jgi:hypothetical protein
VLGRRKRFSKWQESECRQIERKAARLEVEHSGSAARKLSALARFG